MSTTRNQHKRLYWYTVLAAITLLTYWSTLPKTADSDTVIAGSLQQSTSLHIDFELPALKVPDVVKKLSQKTVDAFRIITRPKSQKANAIRFKRLNLDKVSSYENAEKLAKSGSSKKWINGEKKVYKNTEKAEEAMASTVVRLASDDKAIMIFAAG
ncbi:unnamed protein product [Peronospora belbahrii]|uniref:Uncharacterized protein n=1 Tax=Peronospora belbahrii TaxID=622444 RepID=A0ABN8CY53_9STRA|nr:unnamed protein product [Peronospora belbahrii]